MRGTHFILAGVVMVAVTTSGCVVRSYEVTQKRMDQDLSAGNRGFLAGASDAPISDDRKKTRTTQVMEFEFGYPFRIERRPKVDETGKTAMADDDVRMHLDEDYSAGKSGNRGYVMATDVPEIGGEVMAAEIELQEYTVQQGDTLQKIAKAFFGTTKKWVEIYKANQDALSSPNQIYPGQTILIPTESISLPDKIK